MRRLVTCHHLAGIGEDGGGEQAKGIDTWVEDREYWVGEDLRKNDI